MRLFFPRGTNELGSLLGWHARQVPGRAGTVRLVSEAPRGEDEVQPLEAGEPLDGSGGGRFDVGRYYAALEVRGLRAAGRRLLVAAETSSTQEVLRGPLFDGWENWRLAFVADRQSAGRGRGANRWVSPEGCLMWSFQLVQLDGARLPMLQYLVALAAVRAVRQLPGGEAAAERLRIKWPNDLYAAEREGQPAAKLGGILCQSSYWQGQFVVTVGVGLNVANAEPSACLQQLFAEPEAASREATLAAFFSVFEEMLDVFDREGFAPFVADYERSWMHGGQRLQLEDGTSVVVEGLAPHGLLRARDQRGVCYELHPDGNSLDWFRGLVKKKAL